MERKPGPTREQEAVGAWLDRASFYRVAATDAALQMPSMLPYFDHLTDAVASFGRSELHARALDRAVAMDLFADQRKPLAADVKKYQKAGFQQLDFLRKTLGPLEKEIDGLKLNKKVMMARLKECRDEFRLAVADWELKGTDAAKLDKVLDEIMELVEKRGLIGIPEYLASKADELQELRGREDRGAVDNIPWWKLAAVAGFVGWTVLFWVICNTSGCRTGAAVAYQIIVLVHFLLFMFC